MTDLADLEIEEHLPAQGKRPALRMHLKHTVDPDDGYLGGAVHAHDGEHEVGYLPYGHNADNSAIQIGDMEVTRPYRRRGVASAMLDFARAKGVPVVHNTEGMTSAGQAFMRGYDAQRHTAMGQAGPDYHNLRFETEKLHANHVLLHAVHPEHGRVGVVGYGPTDQGEPGSIGIAGIDVPEEHQRRGVASQLMGEIERRHPGTTIYHSNRSNEGNAWAEHYYGPEASGTNWDDDEDDPHGGDWEAHPTRDRKVVEAMGQAGPDYDNLTFHDMTGETYGLGPAQHHDHLLFARHPDEGYIGRVHYTPARGLMPLKVHNLSVNEEHQRRGVASQLMGELERRNPNTTIDHGMRSPHGTQWAKDYYGHEGTPMDDGWSISQNTRDRKLVAARHTAVAKRCPCGMAVQWDPIDGWQHADGSISHDGQFFGKSVSDLVGTTPPHQGARHTAAATSARQLPESEVGPLYHGTTAENAETILAHGFTGNPDRKGMVYLTKDPDLAMDYAKAVAGHRGGTPAVVRAERVRGVSGHEVGFMDPVRARAAGAHYQDKHDEVLVFDPARIEGITRHASRHTAAEHQLPPGYDMDVREQEMTRWGLPALHVRVNHDGKQVGSLSVHQRQDDTTGGALVGHPNISVDPEHQRKGLGTAMYGEIHRRWPDVPVVHSEHASEDARALNQTLQGRFGPDLHHGKRDPLWYWRQHTAADEQQTEHVLAEDVPHQGDHPSAPSDDDHPSFFAPGKRFSFRHVPLDKVLGHEQRCPGGRHGAHCYTGDKWEHPHHAHDTDRPYFEDEATPEQIAKGPKGHWTDERGEAHPYYRDDADNVARMAEHPHELPALVIQGGGMNGGGHRTAAWREAGMTHVPAWVHDDELADWDSAGARKQASKTAAADWHEFRRIQDSVQQRYERPGVAGSAEDKDRYFGTGEMMGHGVERQLTPKDWITHSRGQQLHDVEPEFQEHWRGHELGYAHGVAGQVDHEELEHEYGRSPHPEHFSEGYADGLESAMERVAVMQTKDRPALVALGHVSGNTIDAIHCPFCGSGSVTARSDGSIECGFCTAAYTVQVQPEYSAFPMSVDGNPYPFPGRDDMGAQLGGAVPGAEMDGDGLDEDGGGDDAPPWAQDGADGSEGSDGDADAADDSDGGDEDDEPEASVGGKKAPPFTKKTVLHNARGTALSLEDYQRHLAIVHAQDPRAMAQSVKAERQAAR